MYVTTGILSSYDASRYISQDYYFTSRRIIKFLVRQYLLYLLVISFSGIIWHYYDDPSCTYGNSKRLIFYGIRLSIVVRCKNGDSVRKRNEWSYLTPDGEQRVNRRDSLDETHFRPGEREYFRTKAACRRSLWYKTFIDIRPREGRIQVKDLKAETFIFLVTIVHRKNPKYPINRILPITRRS